MISPRYFISKDCSLSYQCNVQFLVTLFLWYFQILSYNISFSSDASRTLHQWSRCLRQFQTLHFTGCSTPLVVEHYGQVVICFTQYNPNVYCVQCTSTYTVISLLSKFFDFRVLELYLGCYGLVMEN